jgi:hypothetical protein
MKSVYGSLATAVDRDSKMINFMISPALNTFKAAGWASDVMKKKEIAAQK